MFQNRSVNLSRFSMVPMPSVPRSRFDSERTLKTTMDAGWLVPIYVDDVLPGDSFSLNLTAFARLSTPLVPVMDNLWLETFFFFVPNRLLWTNWKRFMGEQDNPADSISYTQPTILSTAGGYAVGSIFDYFGLPTAGQVAGSNQYSHLAYPLRAYNLIWNEWFRDENFQNSLVVPLGDGVDSVSTYTLKRRGKRHDYFTSALPWPIKGFTGVTMPSGGSAPIYSSGNLNWTDITTGGQATSTVISVASYSPVISGRTGTWNSNDSVRLGDSTGLVSNLTANLQDANTATINSLRNAFSIQRFLENDARGGTRYIESLRSHFGVISPDARLQRSEYLGGGSVRMNVNPIAQTSGTGASGTTTPLGQLGAMGTALVDGHGFSSSFTEHGWIIGLANVRADLTYQQGLEKMWRRSSRYDYYWPEFANLGEMPVRSWEIYLDGSSADNDVFGYQEAWSEYRYKPSKITGLFRSTSAGTLDIWHLAQKFTSRPVLNDAFISDTPPIDRISAVPSQPDIILDAFFRVRMVRPLPMYSTPAGLTRF